MGWEPPDRWSHGPPEPVDDSRQGGNVTYRRLDGPPEPDDDSRWGGNTCTDGHMGLRLGDDSRRGGNAPYRWSHGPPEPGDDSRWGGDTHTDGHTGFQKQDQLRERDAGGLERTVSRKYLERDALRADLRE